MHGVSRTLSTTDPRPLLLQEPVASHGIFGSCFTSLPEESVGSVDTAIGSSGISRVHAANRDGMSGRTGRQACSSWRPPVAISLVQENIPFSRLNLPLTEGGQHAQPARHQGRVVALRAPARTTPSTRGFPHFIRCGAARLRPDRGSVKGMVPWTVRKLRKVRS